jgi:hypothetical protein
VEHYDYRVPRAGDRRHVHGSLAGKLVRLLPSGRVPTREEAYLEGLRMGEAYDNLPALPDTPYAAKIDVVPANGKPAESVQAQGLHVFAALNALLQRIPFAPDQYDGAYFKAAYDILEQMPGLQKTQWPDGWNYIRKLERKLQFAATPDEKAAYNAQLFGFLRGINEGMIAQRYVAQSGRLPDTLSGKRMYRALLSLLDAESIDAVKTEAREELAIPPTQGAAVQNDLLSALKAAQRLIQEGNKQGRTPDAVGRDVQALLNPYFERILADGTAPDTLSSGDRLVRAWAVSELFALYTLFNKPLKPVLEEELRNSLKIFEQKGIKAITSAA